MWDDGFMRGQQSICKTQVTRQDMKIHLKVGAVCAQPYIIHLTSQVKQ